MIRTVQEKMIKDSDKEWAIQNFNNSTISIEKTEIKYCKKRKEFFTEEFPEIWYKAPYKVKFNH
jgi:hypothetical protein